MYDNIQLVVAIEQALQKYTEIEAFKAEIEAMKTLNADRLANNATVAYNESDFFAVADNIRNIGA